MDIISNDKRHYIDDIMLTREDVKELYEGLEENKNLF